MRKTKIVCTLGPSTDQPGILRQLLENGMNVSMAITRNTKAVWISCAH